MGIIGDNLRHLWHRILAAETLALALAVLPLHGQTAVSPYRALHPIMPDPNERNAPSSVSQSDLGSNGASVTAPAQAPGVKTRMDACLKVSKMTVLGTIDGIKATLYVTNVSTLPVTPQAQFTVCDSRGGKVGTVSKTGTALAAGDYEKIEILATNLNAADLKLLKLTAIQIK
jgi:hypothetical protein